MSQPDPEYLLGGYATGTLTPEERALLLKAALKDQVLFDALMDEEVLRELLADPKARKRLLAVLPHKKPLLLRPQILAMAAGLVLVVATTWMLERAKPLSSVTPPAVAQEEALQQVAPPSRERPMRSELRQKKQEKPSNALPVPAPAPAAEPPPSRPVEPEFSRSIEDAKVAKSMDAAEGVQARFHAAPAPTAAKAARRMEAAASPRPTFRLERRAGGVEVLWSGQGHLYVLKRSPAGVQILRPAATRVWEAGGLASSFEFTLAGKEVLDIYLLQESVPDPSVLPAETPVGGLWRRIE